MFQTYNVPAEETVLVEPGDFLAFHYDSSEPQAKVRILTSNQTPEGEPPLEADMFLVVPPSFIV